MHHPGGFHWLGLDDQHDLRSLSLCRTVTFLRGVFPIGGILFFFGVDHGEETDGIILGVIISLCYVEISLYFKFPRQITKT